MTESGMAASLEVMRKRILELQRKYPEAWAAAGYTALNKILDRAEPSIPVKTGELKNSDFATRTNPARGGFGAAHAAAVHELDGGKGWKFLQRATNAMRASVLPIMAGLVEQYAAQGVNLSNVPGSRPDRPSGATGAARRGRSRARTRVTRRK